ncbi:MAG: ribbon-helix-helix domain-containing protein, partial [Nitrososphaerota archaeon]
MRATVLRLEAHEICSQRQTKIGRRGRPWKAGAEKLTERVTVRLSWSELQSLRRMAEEEGMAVSEFIRYLISREDVERFKRSISEVEEVMRYK